MVKAPEAVAAAAETFMMISFVESSPPPRTARAVCFGALSAAAPTAKRKMARMVMVGCLRREGDDLGLHVDGGAAVMSQHIPASIVRAVRDGDLATLGAWLESGGSEFVDEMIEDRDYLIERAIEADSANAAATVDLLLRAGAQPLRQFVEDALDNSNGKRANAEAALNLLKSGADMRGGEDENWTALHSACRLMETGLARQDEVVRALLEAGAPVDAQDGYHGKTPLMYAAWSGFTNPLVLSCVEIKILRRVVDLHAIAATRSC